MAVVLNGREHRITVEPGPQGRRQFEREIRRLFSLAEDDELEFTFDCQAPGMPHKPEGVLLPLLRLFRAPCEVAGHARCPPAQAWYLSACDMNPL